MNLDFSTPSALTTSLRQIANAIGGIVTGFGIVNEEAFTMWSGLAISVGVSLFAVWKQFKMKGVGRGSGNA